MARLKIPPNTKYGNSLRCERVEEEDRRQNHTFQKMTAETRVSLDLVAVRQAREIFPSEQYPRKKCMEME